ncbi:hypothetical protein STEG23_017087 [Scotinomys teguina]
MRSAEDTHSFRKTVQDWLCLQKASWKKRLQQRALNCGQASMYSEFRDLRSDPSTHTRWLTPPVTPVPMDLTPSAGLHRHPYTHTHMAYIHRQM